MKTITYESHVEQDKTVSAFLMMFLEYGQEIGLFLLLDRIVKVHMKEVVYSVLNKAQTVIASLVMGCKHTKAINEVLGEEEIAANYLGMFRFPEQSQINRYLTRFSADNVAQLGEVHQQIFVRQSQARRSVGRIVVDIDQCGLVVNGKTYELARKGYFPRKRGEIGYQLSVAYVGAYEEAVQIYLDPGNSVCGNRLSDLLRDLDQTGLSGYFMLKGRNTRLAKRLGQTIPDTQWIPVAEAVHGIELPPEGAVRRCLYEFWQADGQHEYSILYTNLPLADLTIAGAFAFYNERTTIEAFFAQSRHVFNIQSMRSRQFNAIFAFLRFVFLTHNVLVWAKHTCLADSDFAQATTRQLLSQVPRIRAHITWDGFWHVWIIGASRWATALRDTLSRPPRLVQLPLPFARLYKT